MLGHLAKFPKKMSIESVSSSKKSPSSTKNIRSQKYLRSHGSEKSLPAFKGKRNHDEFQTTDAVKMAKAKYQYGDNEKKKLQ